MAETYDDADSSCSDTSLLVTTGTARSWKPVMRAALQQKNLATGPATNSIDTVAAACAKNRFRSILSRVAIL